ncbi:MAG: hypothetical protein KGQ60_15855, partial [Planctomycetes bacterium]|nr:hypothetical protein [Planctomycetota bacterium]
SEQLVRWLSAAQSLLYILLSKLYFLAAQQLAEFSNAFFQNVLQRRSASFQNVLQRRSAK